MHMIRYIVRSEHVEENEQLVRAIIDELRDVQPAGLRYAAYKLADGVSFVHMIAHEPGFDPLPGRQLDAVRAFHTGLRERCVEQPERSELSVVGEFRRATADEADHGDLRVS